MIDLHLHTTASDGCDSPAQLVARVAQAGIRVFAVTDHDTVAGLGEASAAALAHGLRWIPGIEITAVEDERDVHVLGYGFDTSSKALATFLADQRASRVERIRQFATHFEAIGVPFDASPLIAMAESGGGRSVGRAHIARALVAGGAVPSIEEAFERWLSPGRPAFVPRRGAPVLDVTRIIAEAGGIASLAHPGLLRHESLVERLLGSGLHALEAYHSEHDQATSLKFIEMANRAGLAISGGSDFHGGAKNAKRPLGGVTLPAADYRALRQRASDAGTSFFWPTAEE